MQNKTIRTNNRKLSMHIHKMCVLFVGSGLQRLQLWSQLCVWWVVYKHIYNLQVNILMNITKIQSWDYNWPFQRQDPTFRAPASNCTLGSNCVWSAAEYHGSSVLQPTAHNLSTVTTTGLSGEMDLTVKLSEQGARRNVIREKIKAPGKELVS